MLIPVICLFAMIVHLIFLVLGLVYSLIVISNRYELNYYWFFFLMILSLIWSLLFFEKLLFQTVFFSN